MRIIITMMMVCLAFIGAGKILDFETNLENSNYAEKMASFSGSTYNKEIKNYAKTLESFSGLRVNNYELNYAKTLSGYTEGKSTIVARSHSDILKSYSTKNI